MEGRVGAIEVVRGDLTPERSEEILDFLSGLGGIDGEVAREQLAGVVSISVDDTGEIIGVDAVREETVPLVRRRFWVYRQFIPEGSGDLDANMFNAAFEALADEFDGSGSGPIGLAVILEDLASVERRAEPVWPETELIYAGYLPGGGQLRIRYFWGAAIGPGHPDSPSIDEAVQKDRSIRGEYRIERLGESDAVSADEVLAFWAREKAVRGQEALRRVHEVKLAALTEAEGIVGVSSAYLQRSAQLGMDLWYYRTYVAGPHRRGNLAAQLLLGTRDMLENRFERGEDTRAGGIVFELENEDLKRHRNKAEWLTTGFTFIGESKRGDHVRLHYFPGARVPLPGAA